jgi:hypothetical protein
MKKQTEETKIKHQVRDYLKLYGYFVFPIMQGLGAYKGIADFCVIGYGYTFFIEIKTKKGKQSEHQKTFEHDIISHGGHYGVVTCIEDLQEVLAK